MSIEDILSQFNDVLLDSLNEQVVVVDAAGRIRWANTAWLNSAKLRGADLETVSPGSSYLDVLEESADTDHEVARILNGIKGVLEGTIKQFEAEYDCSGKGEYRFFVGKVTPLKHREGGAIIAHLDITNQKLAERERDSQRQELARAASAAALGQLSGAIAHEVSQPLTAILANAQTARATLGKAGSIAEVAAALEDIERDSWRASSILRRIRDLVGHHQVRAETVNINDVIEKTLALCKGELAAQTIRLGLSLNRDLPPVRGDPIALQQVTLNLVMNAYEAMKSADVRERRLEISTSRAGPNHVAVMVADTGPGLTEEAADKLYEPLFSTKADGMGLGLSISRSIINAHDGTLSIISPAAGGVVARIELPIISQH
jgi:C4-dicarboxylate-specific signal transduction histidine kinase